MSRITRDPLIRRFVITCILAAAFVWVAVVFFGVEKGVVWRFFFGSVALVIAMIVLAWLFSLVLIRLRRRRGSFLDEDDERSRRKDDDDRPS